MGFLSFLRFLINRPAGLRRALLPSRSHRSGSGCEKPTCFRPCPSFARCCSWALCREVPRVARAPAPERRLWQPHPTKRVCVGLCLLFPDVLLSAEVSGLPGGDRLDCVKASDQCLKEQSCSTKYRTLRQCVAGKESNFSRATGLEAKDECKSAMEALKQKSLYNCRCKRGMKKEKNCLRIYWSMYQSLQGTLQNRNITFPLMQPLTSAASCCH